MINTYIKPSFKYFNLTEKGVNPVMDEPGPANNSDKVNRFPFFEKCENTIASVNMNCIIDDMKKEYIEGVAAHGDNTSLIKEVLYAPEKNGIKPEDKLLLCRKNTQEKNDLTIIYGCAMELAAYMGDKKLMSSLKAAGFDWRVKDCVEVFHPDNALGKSKGDEYIGYLKLRNPDYALIFLELPEDKRNEIIDEMYGTEDGPLIFGEEIFSIISSNRNMVLGYSFRKAEGKGNGDRHCITNIRKAVNEIAKRNEENYELGGAPVYIDISSAIEHALTYEFGNSGGYNSVREYDFGIGTVSYFYEVEARRMVIPFLKMLNRGEYSFWKGSYDYQSAFNDPFFSLESSDKKSTQGISWETEDELFEKLLNSFVGRGDRYSLQNGLMSGVAKLCDTDAKKASLIKTELVHISGSLLFVIEEEMEKEIKPLRRILKEWKWSTAKLIDEVWRVTEINWEEVIGEYGLFFQDGSNSGGNAMDILRFLKVLKNEPVTLSAKSKKAMNLMCAAYHEHLDGFYKLIKTVKGDNKCKELWLEIIGGAMTENLVEAIEKNIIPASKTYELAMEAIKAGDMDCVPVLMAYSRG